MHFFYNHFLLSFSVLEKITEMKVKILVIMQEKCPSALDKILNQEIESIEVTLSSQVAILSFAD